MTDGPIHTPVHGTGSLWQRILTDSFEEIYVFDAATLRFIQVSRGALDNLGYSMAEMLSLTAKDLKPDISNEEFDALIQPLRSGEKDLVVFETRHQRKDGSCYPVEVRLQLASDESPPVFIAIILDRAEQKKAREFLHSSEKRFRDLVEQSPFSIQIFSPDGRTLVVNPAWERLMGVGADALQSYNVLEDRQLIGKGIMPYIEKGFSGEATEIPAISYSTAETPQVDAPPVTFCVRTYIYPIKDEAGKVQEVVLMHEDVSEKEQALRDLRRSEARLAEAQRIAHLGSWQLDLLSNDLQWSDEIFRIFEIDSRQFGASYEAFLDAIHPDDREQVNMAYLASVENRLPYEIEHRLLMKDGRVKFVQERCETHYDDKGKPLRSTGTLQDISKRKFAEAAARENEQRFHILAQISPVGIYRTDAEGRCVYVNERWQEMAGLTAAQAMGEGWAGAIHPDDREQVFHEWQHAARTQTTFRTECRFKQPDSPNGSKGKVIWLLAQASAELDSDGNVTGYVGTTTDITLHKRIEVALSEIAAVGTTGESLFQRLVLSLAKLFGADTTFVGKYASGAMNGIDTLAVAVEGEIAENTRYEFSSLPCVEVVNRRGGLSVPSGIREQFPDCTCTLVEKIGAEGYVGTSLINSAGKPVGIIAIIDKKPIEDIELLQPVLEMFAIRASAELERQEAEQAIRNQRDQLEQEVLQRTAELTASNKELESFAYSVSHDLRSPLRAIDGFSQALLDDYGDRLDKTAGDYLRRVRAGTQRMGSLIDDMLQLSQVTRGEFSRQSIDLSSLANSVIGNLQESSPRQNVHVVVEPGMIVSGDRRLLGVLLDNLLGNAWKYSSKKESARIEVGSVTSGDEQIFFVKDNGAGFNMKYLDKVFVAFQRLHSGSEFEGSGVGLATVQRVINCHNGRVWAEAEEGKGATFYFTLG